MPARTLHSIFWTLDSGGYSGGNTRSRGFQLYLALSGTYRQIIEEHKIDTRAKEILVRSGKVGYVARSILWFIIGYFLLQASLQADSSEAGDTDTALNYLEYHYGSLTLAVVGAGLLWNIPLCPGQVPADCQEVVFLTPLLFLASPFWGDNPWNSFSAPPKALTSSGFCSVFH